MKLEHVALTVTDYNEIEQFYHEILGLREIKRFTLNRALSRDIFGIEKETAVFQLQKDKLLLEIFLTPDKRDSGFNHICISINNREEIVKKATQHSYKCLRLERENSDLIFITDNSGNIFEVKQSNEV
ncbi:MAG: VOC family protein [Bacteroidales bacterium]|nr:VOC family protein [Bacteroidales bacterium]